MERSLAALGHVSLLLARRAVDALGAAGIAAEVFRDNRVFERAQAEYTASAGLAYLRATSFDPEAFGVTVAAEKAEESIRILEAAGIRLGVLDAADSVDSSDSSVDPAPLPAAGPPLPAARGPAEEPPHPYRSRPSEQVCLSCGEPDVASRPIDAPCVRCGGKLVAYETYVAARRRVARRWAALLVFALLAFGIASPRFSACHGRAAGCATR